MRLSCLRAAGRFFAASSLAVAASGAAVAQAGEGPTVEIIGRLQLDYASVDADLDGFTDSWSDSEIRRARIGVEGEDGKIGYRLEVTIDDSDAILEDAWIDLDLDAATLIVGQWKTPVSLADQTSSRHGASMEKASFVEAFGFGRRVGVGASVVRERFTFKAGVFGDNANDDPGVLSEGTALAARATFNPPAPDGRIIHLGASVQHREAADGALLRYRARPDVHLSDRFVDTGAFADSDTFLGVEAAYVAGPFYVSGEYGVLSAKGPTADADLRGGYVEGGLFLTRGDSKGYRNGAFDRTRPVRTINEGGVGAWELRGRVDRLDLDDGLVAGGAQTVYTVGVNWFATDALRFLAELNHAEVKDGPSGSGDVDGVSLRAAIDW